MIIQIKNIYMKISLLYENNKECIFVIKKYIYLPLEK